MRASRLFQYVMAIIVTILIAWIAIRTIMVVAEGEDKSLVFNAISIGVLCFGLGKLIKAIDKWDG